MNILVTGGAGFIGSAVIHHIIKNTNDMVINLDKLTYAGNLQSLAEGSDNSWYAFERIYICDRHELEQVFSADQPDAIIRLSAESYVDRNPSKAKPPLSKQHRRDTYTLLEVTRQYWAERW